MQYSMSCRKPEPLEHWQEGRRSVIRTTTSSHPGKVTALALAWMKLSEQLYGREDFECVMAAIEHLASLKLPVVGCREVGQPAVSFTFAGSGGASMNSGGCASSSMKPGMPSLSPM